MDGFKKDFWFATESVVSISSVCGDGELAQAIRQSDYIRHETLRRTWSIPSMQYKSREWKNRYYDFFKAKVIAELN